MEKYIIEQLHEKNAIYNAILQCSDFFFNQALNNPDDIGILAAKFACRANVDCITVNSKVAGFISYYCNDSIMKNGYISMLVVRGAFQGKGLGTLLMNSAINNCRCNGMERIRLEVDRANETAIGFYQKIGFMKEGNASEHSDYYVMKIGN